MKFNIISWWICIFLFAGLSSKGFCGNEADSLKELKLFREAALAYEKEVYFANTSIEQAISLLKKAACLKEINLYSDAQKSLSRANYTQLTDSLMYELRYQTALCAYLSADFGTAETQLLQINSFLSDSTAKKNATLLLVLVLNETQRWNEAFDKLQDALKLSTFAESQKDSILKKMRVYYGTKNIPHLKRVKKAELLATFMPGSGHIYAGYFWEGLANLSFQLAALAFTGFNIYTHYYVTSLFIGYSVFQKFYMGGVSRVAFLVKKRNSIVSNAFNQKVKSELVVPIMNL